MTHVFASRTWVDLFTRRPRPSGPPPRGPIGGASRRNARWRRVVPDRDKGSYPYRLGGIPRTGGKVKVVVLQRSTRIGSASVTIAPGNGDTAVPDLKVDPR